MLSSVLPLRHSAARVALASMVLLSFFAFELYNNFREGKSYWSRQHHGEEGVFIEPLEGVLWFVALVLLTKVLVENRTEYANRLSNLWLMFMALLCFLALGEELNWGQHIVWFETPERISAINKQREFNLHNTNISLILGLSKDNALFLILDNLTALLNPIGYSVAAMIWVVNPLAKNSHWLAGCRVCKAQPCPSRATSFFLLVALLGYLIVDKVFFDVAELLEYAISATAALAALDIYFRQGCDLISVEIE